MKERGNIRSDRKTRYKQVQDDLKEKRGYWQLKEEALERTLWKTSFGRYYGPVVRQTTGSMCFNIEPFVDSQYFYWLL